MTGVMGERGGLNMVEEIDRTGVFVFYYSGLSA